MLQPQFALAYYNRSVAWMKLGNTARAAADRKMALKLDPNLDGE